MHICCGSAAWGRRAQEQRASHKFKNAHLLWLSRVGTRGRLSHAETRGTRTTGSAYICCGSAARGHGSQEQHNGHRTTSHMKYACAHLLLLRRAGTRGRLSLTDLSGNAHLGLARTHGSFALPPARSRDCSKSTKSVLIQLGFRCQ